VKKQESYIEIKKIVEHIIQTYQERFSDLEKKWQPVEIAKKDPK